MRNAQDAANIHTSLNMMMGWRIRNEKAFISLAMEMVLQDVQLVGRP